MFDLYDHYAACCVPLIPLSLVTRPMLHVDSKKYMCLRVDIKGLRPTLSGDIWGQLFQYMQSYNLSEFAFILKVLSKHVYECVWM